MFDELTVQDLASRRGDPLMTSFYLDVDGRRFPRRTDYEPHVTSLFHAARRRAAGLGDSAPGAVEADLDRVRLLIDDRIDRATTRGIAVFSCSGQGYFEPLLLPVPVHDQVSIAPAPDVAQLLNILEHRQRTLVVLADRRQARLVRVDMGIPDERPGVLDEPERQADTDVELGGWQHRHEEAARRHFRRVASRVFDEFQSWHPDQVILGGPVEDIAGLEACVDNAVADVVVGTVSLSIRAPAGEIAAAVLATSRDLERRREEALVEELHERASQGRKAVLGLPAVMAALGERRVGTLVVARGFHAVGAGCPACGHIGVAACQCPECGTPSTEVDDIVEVAINRALAQDATVEFCEETDLDRFGGVGALERF
jgi:hypothetical protein